MNVRITVPKTIKEYEDYMIEATQNQFPAQTTELMMASAYGDILNVQKLASKEAGMLNAAGNTALIYACSNGSVECIRLLLGVEDIRHRNKLGLSGVDCSFRARRMEACRVLEEYCLEHGYDELKPKIAMTSAEEREAVEQLKNEYGLDAERMFESSLPAKSRFCAECGGRYRELDKFCEQCGSRRK